MACYRTDNCGPHANTPCAVCPASKLSYLEKHPENEYTPQFHGLLYHRPLGMTDPVRDEYMCGKNQTIRKQAIYEWLENHRRHDDQYAVCMKPEFIIDACISEQHILKTQCKNLRKFLENPDSNHQLLSIIKTDVEATREWFTNRYPELNIIIKTPETNDGYMGLTWTVDESNGNLDHLTDQYVALSVFDNMCELIFLAIVQQFKYGLTENADLSDRDKLKNLMQNIIATQNISRPLLTQLLLQSGYRTAETLQLLLEAYE